MGEIAGNRGTISPEFRFRGANENCPQNFKNTAQNSPKYAISSEKFIFGLSLSDDLIDWNSKVCPSVGPFVRLCVRPQNFFSDFNLIWYVGRPRPDVRTSMTSTRSKVKIKVTELLKFRKLQFSRSISCATLYGGPAAAVR